MMSLLIDTDILIDYLRGTERAVSWLEKNYLQSSISVVTIAELYSGVREGKERKALDTFITAFQVINVDDRIALRGGLIRREYHKSHGTGLADAIIAATASINDLRLVTLNRKHFPMLTAVLTPYQKNNS